MNRYFTIEDKKLDITMPTTWWSRPTEYQFILNNIDKDDVVLDAGCGIEHPLKNLLKEKCKKLVAIDKNPEVESMGYIHADILDFDTGERFDKIILCSVLDDEQSHLVEKFENMKKLLKNGGKIIVTATDPIITPSKILEFSKKANLVPTSQFNEEKNNNLLYHSMYGFTCFNVILENEKKVKELKVEDRKTKVEKGYKMKDL